MLTYKYSIDEVYEKPLIPERVKTGKRSWLTTVVLLPVLVTIGLVLLLYSPIKVVQLTIEKFSHQ
ncbi:hypothetical protein MASR1M107_22100 [Ignavibacteriales bacterium]